jgi:hypothetical protein
MAEAILPLLTRDDDDDNNDNMQCNTKSFIKDALSEYCTNQIPIDADKSIRKDFYMDFSFLDKPSFYKGICSIIVIYVLWRWTYDKMSKLHDDNVRIIKSIYHMLVPSQEFHVIGDIMAPYFLYFTYFIGILLYIDQFCSDILEWNQYVQPFTTAIFLGASFTISQAIKSWWEKINLSSNYTFIEGDYVEIDIIKGLVKEIKVNYVLFEVEDDEGVKIDKFVPPTFIQDKIVTILKKSRKHRKSSSTDMLGLEEREERYYEDFLKLIDEHIINITLKQFIQYISEHADMTWKSVQAFFAKRIHTMKLKFITLFKKFMTLFEKK